MRSAYEKMIKTIEEVCGITGTEDADAQDDGRMEFSPEEDGMMEFSPDPEPEETKEDVSRKGGKA